MESVPTSMGSFMVFKEHGSGRTVSVTPSVRLRCPVCGGSVVSDAVDHEFLRPNQPIDWESERPRRGRPPKFRKK
jgi:hypothetical protein